MRGPFLAMVGCWAALQLVGCGKGLYTNDPRSPADGALDLGGARGDARADYRPAVDSRNGLDGDPRDDGGTVNSVVFPTGEAGPVELGEARVTVRSGTFAEEVTITLRAISAPRIGPVGTVFQVEQAPAGVHARIP